MSDGKRRVKPPEELAQDTRRLKRRRFMARLGLNAAAAKARINAGYLSQLEHGYKSAGPGALGKLADAYGCKVEDLMPFDPAEQDADDSDKEEVPEAA
jgi:transcriptional regulator with XRE-family HTH domain